MKEQDKRAVESMCRCGLSLEGVISAFSKFPKEEIEEIYKQVNQTVSKTENSSSGMSINCS